VAGQGSEFGGAHRFERPIDACELAPGLENTPQRRFSLESNKRNFLFLNKICQPENKEPNQRGYDRERHGEGSASSGGN